MSAYNDHPVVRGRRAVDANNLRECSDDEVHTFGGTDNSVLTPRMREFGNGNETMQILSSKFVGGLWGKRWS